MRKKYKKEEEKITSILNESAVGYEIHAGLKQDNQVTLDISAIPPCQYSMDEIITNAEIGIEECKTGKGIPHERLKRKTL